jgi:hypothetical protein
MSPSSFSSVSDFNIPVGPEDGNRAFFGQDVLQGLVDGIDDFVHQRQPRWERHSHRIGAPAMLGCSPWIGDRDLLATIERLPAACLVLSKKPKMPGGARAFNRLRYLNGRTNGIELRALSGLAHKALKVNGEPLIVGPYTDLNEGHSIPTFRTVGYRRERDTFPPIAHAKLALLGNICWTDEHPAGGVDDYVWFSPRRLWVSSANFTYASRSSLEFGYWTEDADLMDGVKRFLVDLIGASEDLDATADGPDPDLADFEFDDQAMAEAAAEWHQARVEMAEMAGEVFDEDDP